MHKDFQWKEKKFVKILNYLFRIFMQNVKNWLFLLFVFDQFKRATLHDKKFTKRIFEKIFASWWNPKWILSGKTEIWSLTGSYVEGLLQKKEKKKRNSYVDLLWAAYPPYLMWRLDMLHLPLTHFIPGYENVTVALAKVRPSFVRFQSPSLFDFTESIFKNLLIFFRSSRQ